MLQRKKRLAEFLPTVGNLKGVMMNRRRLQLAIGFVSAVSWLTGCNSMTSSLRLAADALSHAADECLYDVRDRQLTWERSSHCASLSSLAANYIAIGGFQNEPADIRVIAERARTTAWMARAASLPGGKGLTIW